MAVVIRLLFRALVLTVAMLAAFEGGLRLLVGGDVFADAVEINSPLVLRTKLDAMRRAPGLKVAMLGDSLIYGHAMAEAGDSDWRAHALPPLIRTGLAANGVHKPYVGNFGMNGLLPRDIEVLVPFFVAAKPDIVMIDLTLRSFSRDFAPASVQQSRPWIHNFAAETTGGLPFPRQAIGTAGMPFADSYIIKIREFILARLFDGPIKDLVSRARNKLSNRDTTSMPAELLLALRAKQRYSDIDLLGDNPQWLALNRTLALLAESRQRAVIFYATENPDILPTLMAPPAHAAMIERLGETIASQGAGCVVFAPPLKQLVPEDFIDHVHLNYQGNRKLAADLLFRVEQLLKKPC